MSSRMAGVVLIVAAVVVTYLVTALALAATPATQPQVLQPPRVSFTDRYAVIAERNIFLKERSSRRPSDRTTTQPSPRPLEESFTLVGIVHEEGQWRAYVEDKNRGMTMRLTAGDAVARGRVARIEIDGIEYAAGEKPVWVLIGNDLTGRSVAFGGLGSAGGGLGVATSTTGPTTLPLDPNDPNLTLEQRMRLRRLQGR